VTCCPASREIDAKRERAERADTIEMARKRRWERRWRVLRPAREATGVFLARRRGGRSWPKHSRRDEGP
jgi:hypothetical protein